MAAELGQVLRDVAPSLGEHQRPTSVFSLKCMLVPHTSTLKVLVGPGVELTISQHQGDGLAA
jgi:hypothetical protein